MVDEKYLKCYLRLDQKTGSAYLLHVRLHHPVPKKSQYRFHFDRLDKLAFLYKSLSINVTFKLSFILIPIFNLNIYCCCVQEYDRIEQDLIWQSVHAFESQTLTGAPLHLLYTTTLNRLDFGFRLWKYKRFVQYKPFKINNHGVFLLIQQCWNTEFSLAYNKHSKCHFVFGSTLFML